MPSDWKELIKRAKNSDTDFEKVLSKLDPLFWTIAKHLSGGRLTEDLVQVARLKVWGSLSRVDVKRPETIEQFLITVGVNKMIDEVKRRSWRPMLGYDDVDEMALTTAPTEHILFRGLLLKYERYIRQNGSFKGAHKYMAEKYKVSVWTMRQRFHQAARRFLEELKK